MWVLWCDACDLYRLTAVAETIRLGLIWRLICACVCSSSITRPHWKRHNSIDIDNSNKVKLNLPTSWLQLHAAQSWICIISASPTHGQWTWKYYYCLWLIQHQFLVLFRLIDQTWHIFAKRLHSTLIWHFTVSTSKHEHSFLCLFCVISDD